MIRIHPVPSNVTVDSLREVLGLHDVDQILISDKGFATARIREEDVVATLGRQITSSTGGGWSATIYAGRVDTPNNRPSTPKAHALQGTPTQQSRPRYSTPRKFKKEIQQAAAETSAVAVFGHFEPNASSHYPDELGVGERVHVINHGPGTIVGIKKKPKGGKQKGGVGKARYVVRYDDDGSSASVNCSKINKCTYPSDFDLPF